MTRKRVRGDLHPRSPSLARSRSLSSASVREETRVERAREMLSVVEVSPPGAFPLFRPSFSLSLLRGLTSFPPDLQEGRSPCSSLAARERETASSCVCPQSEAGRRKERTSTSEKEIPVLARDKIRRGANERGRRLARGFARCLSDKWRWRLLA